MNPSVHSLQPMLKSLLNQNPSPQKYQNEEMCNANPLTFPSLFVIVLQNLKKDIREANKKNKMLKYLRKKA